jgi:hypothetical protein
MHAYLRIFLFPLCSILLFAATPALSQNSKSSRTRT